VDLFGSQARTALVRDERLHADGAIKGPGSWAAGRLPALATMPLVAP